MLPKFIIQTISTLGLTGIQYWRNPTVFPQNIIWQLSKWNKIPSRPKPNQHRWDIKIKPILQVCGKAAHGPRVTVALSRLYPIPIASFMTFTLLLPSGSNSLPTRPVLSTKRMVHVVYSPQKVITASELTPWRMCDANGHRYIMTSEPREILDMIETIKQT